MGGASLSSSISCPNVLNAASVKLVGASSNCSWSSNILLAIAIGPEATIVPGNTIGIKDNAIYAVGGNGKAVSGNVTVSSPEKPSAPSVGLSGPAQVGACESIVSLLNYTKSSHFLRLITFNYRYC
jgi:hypothetical protein